VAIQAHFLSVALLAVGALGVLIGMSWWTFGPSTRRAPVRKRAGDSDYGLLVPVAQSPTIEQADQLCALLADNGIRATVARERGRALVLVFATDLSRARDHVRRAGV
jgi:hypothetical protein